jgi:hypothetical protein
MIVQSPYRLAISGEFDDEMIHKNTWMVVLHASRTPPHIGLLIDGNYNSLTIKGHELNVSVEALLKMINKQKVETLFIQLKKHPVFSNDYQKEICQHYIQQFAQVKQNEASCLTPIKLFLQEFYAIPVKENELLFELVERLKQNDYIDTTAALHLKEELVGDEFILPIYSHSDLQVIIQSERANYYKD